MSWLKIKSWAEWKLKENLYLYAPFKILSHPGKKNICFELDDQYPAS